MFLHKDIFGYSYRERGVFEDSGNHDIRYPRPEGDMDRYTRSKEEWNGLHIDNSDLKDVAEDVRHLAEEMEDFFDLDSDFNQKGIRLDAANRYEPNM